MTNEPFLTDDTKNGWLQQYCGEDRFGANVTQSALLLLPHHTKNETFIKGFVLMHGTAVSHLDVATELWPDELGSVFDQDTTVPAVLSRIIERISIWGAMMATANGVAAIVPDSVGYGTSYQHNRGFLVHQVYPQASTVSWYEAASVVRRVSGGGGCTLLDNAATLGGYSECGFAAFTSALALKNTHPLISTSISAGGSINWIREWCTPTRRAKVGLEKKDVRPNDGQE